MERYASLSLSAFENEIMYILYIYITYMDRHATIRITHGIYLTGFIMLRGVPRYDILSCIQFKD